MKVMKPLLEYRLFMRNMHHGDTSEWSVNNKFFSLVQRCIWLVMAIFWYGFCMPSTHTFYVLTNMIRSLNLYCIIMENFTILIDHREDGVFLRCLSFLIYLNNYAEASLTIKQDAHGFWHSVTSVKLWCQLCLLHFIFLLISDASWLGLVSAYTKNLFYFVFWNCIVMSEDYV